eukprot:2601724-Pyramimonas_sp.AAC.1
MSTLNFIHSASRECRSNWEAATPASSCFSLIRKASFVALLPASFHVSHIWSAVRRPWNSLHSSSAVRPPWAALRETLAIFCPPPWLLGPLLLHVCPGCLYLPPYSFRLTCASPIGC